MRRLLEGGAYWREALIRGNTVTANEESETGDRNSDENINFCSLLIEETARKLHNDR